MMNSKAIRSRLDQLEEETTEETIQERWDAFMSQFPNDDLTAIAEGTADDDLVYRFLECERLLMPIEVKKVYIETLQEMEDNSEQN